MFLYIVALCWATNNGESYSSLFSVSGNWAKSLLLVLYVYFPSLLVIKNAISWSRLLPATSALLSMLILAAFASMLALIAASAAAAGAIAATPKNPTDTLVGKRQIADFRAVFQPFPATLNVSKDPWSFIWSFAWLSSAKYSSLFLPPTDPSLSIVSLNLNNELANNVAFSSTWWLSLKSIIISFISSLIIAKSAEVLNLPVSSNILSAILIAWLYSFLSINFKLASYWASLAVSPENAATKPDLMFLTRAKNPCFLTALLSTR